MRIVLSVWFCILSIAVQAQSFAPIGAEWVYNTSRGIFVARSDRDTVVKGMQANVITYSPHVDSLWRSYGYWMYDIPDDYVYDNSDTVFIYDRWLAKFTPLYLFNVSDGDTITLPAMLPVDGGFNNPADTVYTFVVDSVKMEQYSAQTLKTVYTRTLNEPGTQDLRYPVYAQRLGNLNTSMRPTCHSCMFSMSDNIVTPGYIRCYTDATMSLNLVNDDCYKNIRVSVPAIPELNNISIYPNPATDEVHIKFGKQINAQLQLFNMAGISVSAHNIANAAEAAINLQDLPPGIYTLRITGENGIVVYRKLTIAK